MTRPCSTSPLGLCSFSDEGSEALACGESPSSLPARDSGSPPWRPAFPLALQPQTAPEGLAVMPNKDTGRGRGPRGPVILCSLSLGLRLLFSCWGRGAAHRGHGARPGALQGSRPPIASGLPLCVMPLCHCCHRRPVWEQKRVLVVGGSSGDCLLRASLSSKLTRPVGTCTPTTGRSCCPLSTGRGGLAWLEAALGGSRERPRLQRGAGEQAAPGLCQPDGSELPPSP